MPLALPRAFSFYLPCPPPPGTYPRAWQPQPPVPTESSRLGPCGRSWLRCCRLCICSGRATLGGRSLKSRASWPRYPPRTLVPVMLNRRGGHLVQTAGSPCRGVPRKVHRTSCPAGGAPHVSAFERNSQVGILLEPQMLEASAIMVRRTVLSTGQVLPDHWVERWPQVPLGEEDPSVRGQFLPQGIGVGAASMPMN